MNPSLPPPAAHRHEFVAFVAAVMAVNTLGVDLMLPALADIGQELGVATANHRQWTNSSNYGSIALLFGRRPQIR